MQDRLGELRNALSYIEDHLLEELEIREIAAQAYLSPFHFQRVFKAFCGMGVGEYIRGRRLTLAAQDIACTEEKVIDIGAKYGYDSPDGFNRAFQRFHGISPSQARKSGVDLWALAPLEMKDKLEGGSMLEYRIVKKPQFTVVGVCRRFNNESADSEIPKFWDETLIGSVGGRYGICAKLEENDREFEYWIADDYIPWKDVPAELSVKVIPGGTWVVFPCQGPLPESLQNVNDKVWTEWLPGCTSYRLAGEYDVEFYAPQGERQENRYSEIWLPVEQV